MPDVSADRRPPRMTATTLLHPLPPASRFVLRGGPQVMTAAGEALRLPIPQTACRASVHGSYAALWLGPDERLVLAPEGLGVESAVVLQNALHNLPHSLVDVSHRQTGLEVRGPQGATLLNAGCALDLHLQAFPIGMCTRTVLAKAEIVLWRTLEDAWHVEVWRSFAAYVARFLTEAANEIAFE